MPDAPAKAKAPVKAGKAGAGDLSDGKKRFEVKKVPYLVMPLQGTN